MRLLLIRSATGHISIRRMVALISSMELLGVFLPREERRDSRVSKVSKEKKAIRETREKPALQEHKVLKVKQGQLDQMESQSFGSEASTQHRRTRKG